MTSDELESLLVRFRALPCSAAYIAAQTGLTQEWVSKLRQDRIKEPGVLKICKLKKFVENFKEAKP